jgi:RNA polymerase sigma-70 factor (sigma-E family)
MGVGGEPVNTVVGGQSAEAVLNGSSADPSLHEDAVLPAGPDAAAEDVEVLAEAEAEADVLADTDGEVPDAEALADPELSDADWLDLAAGTDADTPPADDILADLPDEKVWDDGLAEGVVEDDGPADGADPDRFGTFDPVLPEQPLDDAAANGDGTFFGLDGQPPEEAGRQTDVTETLTAGGFVSGVRPVASVWAADRAVTEIYHREYKSLVRLAVLLLHDVPTAEEVVQDAFVAMHTAWKGLRDSEKALSYLRQAVVNKSRSVLRHRTVVDKNAPKPAPDEPSAEQGALALIERTAVVAALRTLPDRQREAIVLRYYADLSEADIAKTMGISKGAVKSHTARAMAALKSILEQET